MSLKSRRRRQNGSSGADTAPPPNCATSERCSWWSLFAKLVSRATGHPLAFALAVLTIGVWAITGPIFQYSDSWQLVINTGTTIITFLMVFLIQSSQNRESAAVQIKLDELIRALDGAKNELLDLEELEEADLERMRKHYEGLAEKARDTLGHRHGNPAESKQSAT